MSEYIDDEMPYYEIHVDKIVEPKDSKKVCYEFCNNYFHLKKSIYDNVKFNKIYTECIEKSLINNTIPNIHINEHLIYIPDNESSYNDVSNNIMYEPSLKGIILRIFPASLMIINTDIETFIIISYSWKEFLLCDPTKSYAIGGTCEKIIEFIEKYYGGKTLNCIHIFRPTGISNRT